MHHADTGEGAPAFPVRKGDTGLSTVLHVDDDPNDAELLKAACHAAVAAFRLQTVQSGEAAMDYLRGTGSFTDRSMFPFPSLVLLDLKMPRRTGLEVLKWIRAEPRLCKTPVVMLSGSELHEDIARASSGGADGYLVKPLSFEALVEMVRRIQAGWLQPAG